MHWSRESVSRHLSRVRRGSSSSVDALQCTEYPSEALWVKLAVKLELLILSMLSLFD